jgi:hypothetical protein
LTGGNVAVNPYSRLLAEIKKWAFEARHRHTVTMWYYPKDKLETGWTLKDLYERTAAAEQVGYDVVLRAAPTGLTVHYVKQLPPTPYEWE